MGAEVIERLAAGARAGIAREAPAGRGLLAQLLGRNAAGIARFGITVGRLVGDQFMLRRVSGSTAGLSAARNAYMSVAAR